jgi:predicted amidophosphoribosyltransferase
MWRRSVLAAVFPPVCAVCRESATGGPVCRACVTVLNAEGPIWGDAPRGTDECISSFHHDGVARGLLHALKFGRMESLVPLMAGYMTENLGPGEAEAVVVPVPPVRLRAAQRGFDPACRLAAELARSIGGRFEDGAIRRHGFGRQRGAGRDQRIGSPPDIRPARAARRRSPVSGARVLLVDDVMTTGATLETCAGVLGKLGAGTVTAVTFTRRV